MAGISNALNMEPLVIEPVVANDDKEPQQLAIIEGEVTEIADVELSEEEKQAEEDFAIVRENMKGILEKGTEALTDLLRIAAASETPRTFEVVSKMIDTMREANQGLMDLHEKRRQLMPVPQKPSKAAAAEQAAASITNNNVFVGSTAELMEMIENRRTEKLARDNNTK